VTKNKKRKAHTRALAKERGVSYRTALHQQQGGSGLPPDFRVEIELESFRNAPPYGMRLRVPGVEAVSWLDHPRDAERVMEQVAARVPKEFPHVLEDFRLWEQLEELPEEDMSLDEYEWTHISFRQAHRAIEEVLLKAVEHVGWGAWGEHIPSELLDSPTLKGIFELVKEGLTRDSTDPQNAAFAPFFERACAAASRLDAEGCATALKEGDRALRALGWEPPFAWEDDDGWESDEDAYSGPEVFTMKVHGNARVFFDGEASGGLVLRNGDEYVVKAQGRVKLNDNRRCILLTHEALSGGSAVRVRFADTQQVVEMDATDLVWAARGPVNPRHPRESQPSFPPGLGIPAEPAAPSVCLVKECGKSPTGETLLCGMHSDAYAASEEAGWLGPADFAVLEWEVVRQLTFAMGVASAGLPDLTVPPETEASRAQRAERFEVITSVMRQGKARLSER
jgi:hypothetical protein